MKHILLPLALLFSCFHLIAMDSDNEQAEQDNQVQQDTSEEQIAQSTVDNQVPQSTNSDFELLQQSYLAEGYKDVSVYDDVYPALSKKEQKLPLKALVPGEWVMPVISSENSAPSIKRYIEYKIDQKQQEGLYALCIIPGEDTENNPDFFSDESDHFKDIKKLAQHIAERKKNSVSLLSFLWKGKAETVKEEAVKLHYILNSLLKEKREIGIIAYGIGCDIARYTSHIGFHGKAKLDLLILLGAPITKGWVSHKKWPCNYALLLNFYSTILLQAYRKLNPVLKGNEFDIRTQIEGKDPEEHDLKKIVKELPYLLSIIGTLYKHHRDLDLNLAPYNETTFEKLNKHVQLAIRNTAEKSYSDLTEEHLDEIKFSNDNRKFFGSLYNKKDISAKPATVTRGLATVTALFLSLQEKFGASDDK